MTKLKIPIMTALLLFLLPTISFAEEGEEDASPKGVTHNWEEVHVHSEEKLVDKFEKKIKTLVSQHYHDYHVYHTITVYTYRCTLHGEYKTATEISDKRVEKQPH